MGLPLALKAHNEGDLEVARENYIRALEQNDKNPIIFQNYGALLKTLDSYEESEKVYLNGLKLYPNHIGINGNLANLYRIFKPVSALEKYKYTLSLHIDNGASIESDVVRDVILDIVFVSRELGLTSISLLIVVRALTIYPKNPTLLLNLMLLLSSDGFSDKFATFSKKLNKQLEEYIDSVDLYVRFELLLGLATHQVNKDNSFVANTFYDRAIECLYELTSTNSEKSEKARNLLTVNSWNISCVILKLQDFSKGWKLFEYGLQTPCSGKQRWQRALLKPFSSDQLSLWRGEDLSGQSLLLLEEQAIGDVMMFSTLIQTLIIEAESISLFLSARLVAIYSRAYKDELDSGKLHIYSKKDFQDGTLKPSLFNYQSPIGSICQYRFTSIDSYSPRVPCLIADPKESRFFKDKYRANSTKSKLIGVSWRGGVKGARLKQKSIEEDQFLELLLSIDNVRFVSIQYGNCKKVIDSWRNRGLDIIYDETVDSLQNMDTWLSQVSSCDGVLSIANTTIHGAGGLNIPTMCLLSCYADWRWLDHQSIARSYWYPSVGVARQSSQDGWSPAFQVARDWIGAGCPFPTGPNQL